MDQTYIAAIVSILAIVLPRFGIILGSEQLTVAIQVVLVIVSGLWTMIHRTGLQQAPFGKGDVSLLGRRIDR